jgi:hypothetical protein
VKRPRAEQLAVGVPVTPVNGRRLITLNKGSRFRCPPGEACGCVELGKGLGRASQGQAVSGFRSPRGAAGRALSVYLDDPAVPINTNQIERTVHPIPLGRRNWLFCWSEIGAEAVAIIQSLIVTCRLHAIDPYDYLVDVVQRVDQHPASEVHLLTPRRWKEQFAANPLRSDLQGR